jgi:hypothetical protein
VRAISYFLVGPSLAAAISATSGVYVVNTYGFTTLLLACTVLSFCAFLLTWTLKDLEIAGHGDVAAVKNTRLFQWKVLPPAMMSFLFHFANAGVAAFFPLYALRCGIRNPGLFFSASAVMLIVVRLFGGWVFEVYSKDKIIFTFMGVSVAAAVILSFSKPFLCLSLSGSYGGCPQGSLFPSLWRTLSNMPVRQMAPPLEATRHSWTLDWPSVRRLWASSSSLRAIG